MNRIVRKLMPASELPEAWRDDIPADAEVIVTVEVREQRFPGFPPEPERKPMTADELRESIRRYKAQNKNPVTAEEAVARIRELRDEWDDR